MRIGISSTGPDLESIVDPRFGRCRYVIIFEDYEHFEAVENRSAELVGGAGIQTARLVADRDAQVVLTGRCGPNAWGALSAAGIEVYTVAEETVRQAVERYVSGERTAAEGATIGRQSASLSGGDVSGIADSDDSVPSNTRRGGGSSAGSGLPAGCRGQGGGGRGMGNGGRGRGGAGRGMGNGGRGRGGAGRGMGNGGRGRGGAGRGMGNGGRGRGGGSVQ